MTRLRAAGLGYNVKEAETADKLGKIPMRQLVYRVKELPASFFPLIWDFGQLSKEAEEQYIKQIIRRYRLNHDNIEDCLPPVLSACQEFMRSKRDECSFVSLRYVWREVT